MHADYKVADCIIALVQDKTVTEQNVQLHPVLSISLCRYVETGDILLCMFICVQLHISTDGRDGEILFFLLS